MAEQQLRGRVKDGRVELPAGTDLPEGAEVIVTVPDPAPPGPTHPALLPFPEGAIGMWADRTDMDDPVEWVRKMREEKWRRRTNPD